MGDQRISQLRGAASVAGTGLAGTTTVIRDVHAAVAKRIFGLTGRPAIPTRLLHDGISKGVYAAVGMGLRAGSFAAGEVVALATQGDTAARALTETRRGDIVVGAVNGAWGDRLERWSNPLALPMAPRCRDRDVALTREGLSSAYPSATGDVVVFLHGLCETDRAWWLKAVDHYGDPASTHGSRLAALTGATPVYLRYNTGLHISENGARLDALLDTLVAEWPVPVTRLTLVGHSMGGLVVRAACAMSTADSTWPRVAKRIVYLGAPHLGAPLEVAAATAALALRRLPETAPLGVALASRSVGIKDLRYGDIAEADWADFEDLDAKRPEPELCAPLLEGAHHFYLGATLTRQPDHPVSRMIGDCLVTFPSASGSNGRRTLGFEADRGCHVGGLHHFDLLNHPRVWDVLRRWLVDEDVTAATA